MSENVTHPRASAEPPPSPPKDRGPSMVEVRERVERAIKATETADDRLRASLDELRSFQQRQQGEH